MILNPQYTYCINPSVDVYKIGDDVLEFYFISTRHRLTMQVTSGVVDFVNLLSNNNALCDICDTLSLSIEDITPFVSYLVESKVLYVKEERDEQKKLLSNEDQKRYDRQLSFFESKYSDSAFKVQHDLSEERFLVFGVGAIGGGIVHQLAMAGARHFILVDKDVITEECVSRHFYYESSSLGKPKVKALSEFLKRIDKNVECECHYQILDFDTDISELLSRASFVINTMDEPYIGITSLKIGRACYARRLPLYVAGGFDAHLLSTGELIIPDKTPCVDCYTDYFTTILEDWQPKYNIESLPEGELNAGIFEVGGLASMALFAISYATMVIIDYIATGDPSVTRGRGEMLYGQLHLEYLNIPKNENCHVCGLK